MQMANRLEEQHKIDIEVDKNYLEYELFRAASLGEWEKAKKMFEQHPEDITPSARQTVIGFAIRADETEVVEELVEMISCEEELDIKYYFGQTSFYDAVTYGRIGCARILLNKKPDLATKLLPNHFGRDHFLPIEIAAAKGHDDMVCLLYERTKPGFGNREIVPNMDLDKKHLEDELYSAATDGNWEKAKEMFEKHPEDVTPSTRLGIHKETALYVAVKKGKTEFVEKLVEMMRKEELDIQNLFGHTAFYHAVAYGKSRCAWIMLQKKPDLATTLINKYGCEYLPIETAAANGHVDMVRLLHHCTKHGFGNKEYHIDSLLTSIDHGFHETIKRIVLPIQRNHQLTKDVQDDLIKGELFRAVREGKSEFIIRTLRLHPHLANEVDHNNHTLFHVAVQHRHLKLCDVLIQMMGHEFIDRKRDNILHLAAKLPLSGLELVPGPALQLQRELRWIEEVEKMVGEKHKETEYEGCMWRRFFNKEHEVLRKAGEEWLTKTANTCMVVATATGTVSAAGHYNAPGGYKQDTGVAVHHGESWFIIFGIANAMTTLSATISMLCFLSILNSNFAVSEFRKSLPLKLLVGQGSLYLSFLGADIACVAYASRDHLSYFYSGLGLFLMVLASCLQVPRIVQLLTSTYRPLQYSRRLCCTDVEMEMGNKTDTSDGSRITG